LFIPLSLYAILIGLMLHHHAPWRDELQAWLIARDSISLGAVWTQSHYEGTPALWHSLLWLAAHFSHHLAAMKAVHLTIAVMLAAVLWQGCRGSWLEKIALLFGYYGLYQYAVISRNYSIGILCLGLAALAAFRQKTTAPPFWLALATLSSMHALIASLGLATMILWNEGRAAIQNKAWWLYAIALLSAVISVAPFPDTLFPSSVAWNFHPNFFKLKEALGALAVAFFPIPLLDHWETFYVRQAPLAGAILGIVMAAWATASLRTKPGRTGFLLVTSLLIIFFYAKLIAYSRHAGFIFFIFIFARWIEGSWPWDWRSWRGAVWGLVLACQLLASALAIASEFRKPFSQSRTTAQWLMAQGFGDACIASAADYTGTSLAAYFSQPLYYPQGDRWGTFTRWDRRRVDVLGDTDSLERSRRTMTNTGCREKLYVANHLLSSDAAPYAIPLVQFTGSLVEDEDYYVYRLK
jgi:hypothetical protein